MIEHMKMVVSILPGKRSTPVSIGSGSYPEPLCILLPPSATGKQSWFIPAEDLALHPGTKRKQQNRIMFPAQLKIKSESSGRQQSLLPRQLLITEHNLEQFLSPSAASKQQKWTVLHSLTMTVCTWLYWPQKAAVALLSPVSLTSCFFLQGGKNKRKVGQGSGSAMGPGQLPSVCGCTSAWIASAFAA